MKTEVHHPSVVVILRIVPCNYCLRVFCKRYMPLLTTVDLFVKQRYQLASIHNPHLQMGKIGSVFVVILEALIAMYCDTYMATLICNMHCSDILLQCCGIIAQP